MCNPYVEEILIKERIKERIAEARANALRPQRLSNAPKLARDGAWARAWRFLRPHWRAEGRLDPPPERRVRRRVVTGTEVNR